MNDAASFPGGLRNDLPAGDDAAAPVIGASRGFGHFFSYSILYAFYYLIFSFGADDGGRNEWAGAPARCAWYM